MFCRFYAIGQYLNAGLKQGAQIDQRRALQREQRLEGHQEEGEHRQGVVLVEVVHPLEEDQGEEEHRRKEDQERVVHPLEEEAQLKAVPSEEPGVPDPLAAP